MENTGSTESSSAESNQPVESNAQDVQKDPNEFPPADKISEAMKRKFQLKVDGEDIEKEFDLNDTESLKRELQLAHAAKKRMTEANEIKRQAYEMMQRLQQQEQNPMDMFKKMGPKGRELAEQYLLSQMEEDSLTPEQKKYREMEKRIQEIDQKEKYEADKKEKEAQDSVKSKYIESFQKTIIEALTISGLPNSPKNVSEMASLLKKNLALGLDLSPKELAQELREDQLGNFKSIFNDNDPKSIIEFMGKDMASKVLKTYLSDLKKSQGVVANKPKVYEGSTNTQNKNAKSFDDWREELNQRIKDKD